MVMQKNKKYDIVGIGNAIVDLIAEVDDSYLKKNTITKGSMSLVDYDVANRIGNEVNVIRTISGGSVANSIVSIAQQNLKTAFIGKVNQDLLGEKFARGLEKENIELSRPTIYDYLDALERLMIIENQPAWNTHIRSSSSLRKAPKRHLSDVSLAVAVLGIDEELLLTDVKFTGFLFESMVVHDLRVYAQAHKAQVFHYNDSSGLEVDAIVQKQNGDWCAFEIKLGIGQIEQAAKSLLKFASIIDEQKSKKPKSLNIITGTGISYIRPDGINVISIGSLGY